MPVTIYLHLTWTTRQRASLIDSGVEAFLRRFLRHAAERFGVQIIALGAVSDHVHLIVQCGKVVDLPRLVQGLKGASARIANRDGVTTRPLRWADGYDARSVSPRALRDAIAYVRGQAQHHPLEAVK